MSKTMVKLISLYGTSTVEVSEKFAAALVASGKYVRMDTSLGDPFNRVQVEAICRAVCRVEGLDPDGDCYGDNCDPNWTRYADAVASAISSGVSDMTKNRKSKT